MIRPPRAMELILLVSVDLDSASGIADGADWPTDLPEVLSRTFGTAVVRGTRNFDPAFALDVTRNQYLSTAILQRLAALGAADGDTVLGITNVDIFVPVFTYVFGEAQLGGKAALVSTHRLRQEFYGLPASQVLLEERMRKEAIHEVGHVRGLRHCRNWDCVMASAHSVDRLDIREDRFCAGCHAQLFAPAATP